jgi:predicted P-loop ATPase
MDIYNPVEDYFSSLSGKYQGVSNIDLLLSHLLAKKTGDKDEDYYQIRMIKIIKKWLVSAVACAIDHIPNDVSIGFVMEQEGTGKTYLCKFLCPPELEDLFKESSKDKKVFNFAEAFANNIFILFDEFVGLNNYSAEKYKSTLSASKIEIKYRQDDLPVKLSRIGSGIFTSNNKTGSKKGFLTPSLGYRRFGCIHLENINQEYSEKVDIDQVWAEAITLYKGGFDYRWNREDFADFKEYNQQYLIETDAHRIIMSNFSIPEEGDKGEYLQPSQILKFLKDKKRLTKDMATTITPEKIGEALNANGFIKVSKKITGIGARYVYHVKKL